MTKPTTTSRMVFGFVLLATVLHLASSQTCDFWTCNPNICSNCLQCGRASMIGASSTQTVICPINNTFCFTAIYDSEHVMCKVQKCATCTDSTAASCTGCVEYTAPQIVNDCGSEFCYSLNYSKGTQAEVVTTQVDVAPYDGGGSSGNSGTGGGDPKPTVVVDPAPGNTGTTTATPPPDTPISYPADGTGSGGCYIQGSPIAVGSAESSEGSAGPGTAVDGTGAAVDAVSVDIAPTTDPGTGTIAEPGSSTASAEPAINNVAPIPICSPAPASSGGSDGSVGIGTGGATTTGATGPVDSPVNVGDSSGNTGSPVSGSGQGQSGSGTASSADHGGTSSSSGTDTDNFQSAPTMSTTSSPDTAVSSSNSGGSNGAGSSGASTSAEASTDSASGETKNDGAAGNGSGNTTSNSSGTGQTSNVNVNGQNITFPVLIGLYLQTGIVITAFITVLAVY